MKKRKTNHKNLNLLPYFILAFLIGFIGRSYFLIDDAVVVQERAYVEESDNPDYPYNIEELFLEC